MMSMSKDGKNLSNQSGTLSNLAHQLGLHKPFLTSKYANNTRSGTKPAKRAAVLICIFAGDNNNAHLRVLLTKRSSTLSSHSGEVALPGGKMDEGDTDEVATALREAKEEIGLDPQLVDVVCVLHPFTMKNGMEVVPVIGLLYDKLAFQPAPNVAEVEAIFDAPLDMFLKNENRREVEREWMGEKYVLHCFDYETKGLKNEIFALTAGILIETASVVLQKSPAFDVRSPHFWNKASSSH